MPVAPPAPVPQLDNPPPSPAGTNATPPPANSSFSGLAPSTGPTANTNGEMQVTQLILQTTQAVAQGLDMLGKMNPALGPLANHLLDQLREGVRSSLQQGLGTSESSPAAQSSFQGMSGQ